MGAQARPCLRERFLAPSPRVEKVLTFAKNTARPLSCEIFSPRRKRTPPARKNTTGENAPNRVGSRTREKFSRARGAARYPGVLPPRMGTAAQERPQGGPQFRRRSAAPPAFSRPRAGTKAQERPQGGPQLRRRSAGPPTISRPERAQTPKNGPRTGRSSAAALLVSGVFTARNGHRRLGMALFAVENSPYIFPLSYSRRKNENYILYHETLENRATGAPCGSAENRFR